MKSIFLAFLPLLCLSMHLQAQQKRGTIEQQLRILPDYEKRFDALQAAAIDSIAQLIPHIQDTLIKVDVIHVYIDRLHGQVDASLGEEELNTSYQLAKQIDYKRGIAKALKSYGDIYSARGELEKAKTYFKNSIQVAQQIPYYEVMSANMASFASLYKKQADYEKSLRYYLQALETSEKTGNANLIARRLYNLASFYQVVGNHEQSLKFANRSLQKSSDTTLQTFNYHLISDILKEQKKYDQALTYLHKSLTILPQNAGVLYHIGLIYKSQQQHDSALYYLNKSLQAIPQGASFKNLRLDAIADIYEQESKFDQALDYRLRSLHEVIQLHEKHTEAQCYNKLAQHYRLRNNPEQTIYYAKKALTIAQELQALAESKDAYYSLSKAYEVMNQYKPAYTNAELYYQLKDSINSENNMKKIVQMEMQYEFDKKETAQQALQERQKQQTLAIQQQQQYFIYFLFICALLCAILAFVFYRYFRLKQKDNVLLQQFNREVNEQKEEISAQAEELQEVNEEIQKINESLESTVQQRTRQLERQNQQLINYAFYNAHKLRGPLARILGLVNLLKLDKHITTKDTQALIDKLESSSVELDNVVKEINTILQPKKSVNDHLRD